MPKFDATINGISLASYGVEPNMATVPQPEAKTYQAEIPGRDGLLDYTDAYGVVRYENRTVTVEAYEIGDITARMEHRRAICSDMHGKTCTLELTTLPGYAFTGRCSVEYDEDGSETAYKLSFDCQPYMSAGERTFYANCAGGVDLVFMSGDKPVKPRIEVPRRSIIVFNGQQYEVEAGTWTFDGIVFKRGRNEVYINTYTEPGTTTWGDLESMTWEQIGWHHRQSDASGALVNVTDALQARPNKLVVDGKAVQDGTPTPDAPVEIDVVDSPVSVQATGKNLVRYPYDGLPKQQAGLSVTANADGSVTVIGTATALVGIYLPGIWSAGATLKPGTYTFSAKGKASNIRLYVSTRPIGATGGGTVIATTLLDAVTFTISEEVAYTAQLNVDNGSTVDFTFYPQIEVGTTATTYEPYNGQTISITLPSDHNYLASLPDGTRDELVLRSDGVAVLVERVGKRVFNGSEAWRHISNRAYYPFRLFDPTLGANYPQLACDRYTVRELKATNETQGTTASVIDSPHDFYFRDTTIDQTVEAWKAKLAASNVMVYYALATATVRYSADNGTTWSTTDPAAGNSAIQLYKGTNNVWCTDALSPNVTLNYDTQERTRKQRISDLYWSNNQPQRRLTWGQLATNTWGEIGSKSVQEWYYSGTAYVVENAYINYEIGDL